MMGCSGANNHTKHQYVAARSPDPSDGTPFALKHIKYLLLWKVVKAC
jgi:hypothetical protein